MADGDTPKGGMYEIAARWLFGQPATNVLLFSVVMGLGWAGKYLVETGIPSHLAQIKGMVTELEATHREERTETRKQYLESTKETRDQFEKSDERRERWFKTISDKLNGRDVGKADE